MKILGTILQFIVIIILALSILAFILINLGSSYIFNENYILSKLDEHNYYDEIYENAKSNFENYINQSGLDEEVLNDIVTKEKIEEDTKIIIDNIFNGENKKIDTDEINNKLKQNINNSLKRQLSSTEQQSINTFVNTICDEYKTTILHTGYEQKINSAYNNINKYVNIIKKALVISIFVSCILIILLTIRKIYILFARIGISFVIDGLILVLARKYIDEKVRIQGITILNNNISKIIRNIFNEILSSIINYGIILLSIGIILIIVYALITAIKKVNKEKERYNPEK